MKIFFDSSALAKRYILEQGSDDLEVFCERADSMGISMICLPELISAFSRLVREKRMNKSQYYKLKRALNNDIRDIIVCNLTPSVVNKSVEVLEMNTVRGMDAIHVASALEWSADMFVSSDKRQISAAHQAGLQVAQV